MNKSILAVLVSGLLVSGAVQAAAQDNTWYAGGKAGWSKFFDVDQKQVVSDTLGRCKTPAPARIRSGWAPLPAISSTPTWASNSVMTGSASTPRPAN